VRRMVLVLSLTLVVGLGVVGVIGNQVLHAQQAADIEQVKAANQAFYEAFSGRDMKRMDQIWSHERHVRIIHPASKEILSGWDAVRKSWEETFANFEQVTISMKDAEVRVGQHVAWIVGHEQLQGRRPGGEVVTGPVLATNVFEKQGDHWLMVHHHGSRPPTR
jgi:ketosteroid isomerase-like protein